MAIRDEVLRARGAQARGVVPSVVGRMPMNPPQPWWQSPWAIGTGLAVSGVALGAGVAAAARMLMTPADCTAVAQTEGEIGGVRYIERIRGGADPNAQLPMVLLFHSLGATPEGHAAMLGGIGTARLILPDGELGTSGSGRKWWNLGIKDAVEKGRQDEAQVEWTRAADRMAQFVDEISQCRPTLGKPVLTGSSQGGEMALLMASAYPKVVQGAVAVSSYLLPAFWTPKMAPTVMIHGTGDKVVPYDWALQYAQAMQEQGAPLTFDSFVSSGHSVTSPMASAWIAAVKQMAQTAR
jgi:phospholipase/carboxylesterase